MAATIEPSGDRIKINETDVMMVGDDLLQIGVGQTWNTQTRALDVEYVNDTGKPIMVSVMVSAPYEEDVLYGAAISVNGVAFVGFIEVVNQGWANTGAIIVPPGHTYMCSARRGNETIYRWFELR